MFKLFIAAFATFWAGSVQASRPIIMLTGFWPPTNEMLRPWSGNLGENWHEDGYDVRAFFPEFPTNSIGVGDFQVEWNDTREDFQRYTQELKPVAILSFGRGGSGWEVEFNAMDYWNHGEMLHSTLPVNSIARAVNELDEIPASVDRDDDAGDFLCGYLFRLGAEYREMHSSALDPALVYMQGFIHVGGGFEAGEYHRAVEATLNAVIHALNRRMSATPRVVPTAEL